MQNAAAGSSAPSFCEASAKSEKDKGEFSGQGGVLDFTSFFSLSNTAKRVPELQCRTLELYMKRNVRVRGFGRCATCLGAIFSGQIM